ncbi:hypothetical protein HMPREF9135_0415 [Segatella baroniae F0067]|uniref:Uncharacterized protein n=1 Tax=Segatella baroniae F0067 TaxID=1115809 RepID=U2P864_9BACT|nr:hypothetical protein HMPREF9135_0415 [Segatella baroniae F0067]
MEKDCDCGAEDDFQVRESSGTRARKGPFGEVKGGGWRRKGWANATQKAVFHPVGELDEGKKDTFFRE